jgi:small membrane protein
MIIKLLLSVLLLAVAALISVQRTTSRSLQVSLLGIIGVGTWFVWAPEHANALAGFVGVGRGADLLFYLWVVITLALVVIMYLKIQRLARRVTQLARAIALTSPRLPDDDRQAP